MTERDKKLVKDYGPRFIDRSGNIMDDLLYLAADAYSVMTDDEWRNCAKALEQFSMELNKVRTLVFNRLEEVEKED